MAFPIALFVPNGWHNKCDSWHPDVLPSLTAVQQTVVERCCSVKSVQIAIIFLIFVFIIWTYSNAAFANGISWSWISIIWTMNGKRLTHERMINLQSSTNARSYTKLWNTLTEKSLNTILARFEEIIKKKVIKWKHTQPTYEDAKDSFSVVWLELFARSAGC